MLTYLGELMPIQIVTAVKLEDEGVVDFSHSPDLAVHAKEEEQKQPQEVACIKLEVCQ